MSAATAALPQTSIPAATRPARTFIATPPFSSDNLRSFRLRVGPTCPAGKATAAGCPSRNFTGDDIGGHSHAIGVANATHTAGVSVVRGIRHRLFRIAVVFTRYRFREAAAAGDAKTKPYIGGWNNSLCFGKATAGRRRAADRLAVKRGGVCRYLTEQGQDKSKKCEPDGANGFHAALPLLLRTAAASGRGGAPPQP